MIVFKCLFFSQLSLEELYEIMALRQEVFVVEQDCPYLDADGKDKQAWHLLGYSQDQKLVAYTRLIDKGGSYKDYASIGRVVTSASVRKEGYGKLLMQESIRQTILLFNNPPIKISAQVYLDRFYRSLGFEPVGEGYLEDNIPHIAMIYRSQKASTQDM